MSKNSNSEQTNSNNSKNVQNRTTQIPASKKSESVKEGKKIDDLKNNLKNVAHNFKIKELENENIKISLRTKKYLDASKICEQFNGGGHKRAAGCTIYKDIEEAKELIVKEIQKDLEV